MKKNNVKIDMLHGSVWKKIITFALPLAATSILQQVFNSADAAIVSMFSGDLALAAIGVNTPIINVMINLFVGMSVGANVVISKSIGAGNDTDARNGVHTSIVLALIFGVFLGIVGNFFAKPFLILLKTNSDILDMASLYLRIYFAGMPFMMLYNFENAIFRSKGDTKTPLFILVISGMVNIGLNLFFVIVFDMSVNGVAIATVISNALSAVILFVLLTKSTGYSKVEIKKLRISTKMLIQIIKIGLPAGIQSTIFSISNLFIISAVNSIGSLTVAANTAALYYDVYVYLLVDAFSQTAVTFIGQNFGANQFERCRKITRQVIVLGTIVSMTISTVLIIFPRFFLGLYVSDPMVIEIAMARMLIVVSTVFLNIGFSTLSSAMRVYGYSLIPAIITVFCICGVRVAWIFTFFRVEQTYESICWAYPISWIVCDLVSIVPYIIILKKTKEKMKKSFDSFSLIP